MKRRAIIAVILFAIGTAVYLFASGAPPRVQVVTIATEFCLFAGVTFFLCALSMKPIRRMVGAAVSVAIIAIASPWLSSNVISALNPLEPMYFVMGLSSFAIQALVFSGVVWLVDFTIDNMRSGGAA